MTEARPIVDEILRLIAETEGTADDSITEASKYLQGVLHKEQIKTLRQAGADNMIPMCIKEYNMFTAWGNL